MFTLFKHEAINIVKLYLDETIDKMKLVGWDQVIALLKTKADSEEVYSLQYKLEKMQGKLQESETRVSQVSKNGFEKTSTELNSS